MLVPMLPFLAPEGSGHLTLALLFSAKDATQVVFAPLAGFSTLRLGARTTLAASLLGLAATTAAFAEARGFGALVACRARPLKRAGALCPAVAKDQRVVATLRGLKSPDCEAPALARASRSALCASAQITRAASTRGGPAQIHRVETHAVRASGHEHRDTPPERVCV